MPTIKIDIDHLCEEKKSSLIEKLTKEASQITGYPPEYFFVYLQEYPPESIGVGGRSLKKIRE